MTVKQHLAMKKVVENGGNVSRAMIDVGYSPKTAENPQKLTQSKAWEEYLEEYLPDAKLMKVHEEGLEATKIHTSHTEPDREVPDYAVRHKYLDTAYKLKKRLQNDPSGGLFNGARILVVPSELLDKNEIPFDAIDSSQG